MAELLIIEAYLSSENSDDNGRRYVVKELSSQSRTLTKRKKQPIKFYHKQQRSGLIQECVVRSCHFKASLRIAQNGHVLLIILLLIVNLYL